MSAGIYDIEADQGSTFSRPLLLTDKTGTPVNLTGYTAKMQVRERAGAPNALLTLSTTNGTIVLGGIAGTILLTAANTLMNFDAGKYVYDLEITSAGGAVTRILQGDFVLTAEVTV